MTSPKSDRDNYTTNNSTTGPSETSIQAGIVNGGIFLSPPLKPPAEQPANRPDDPRKYLYYFQCGRALGDRAGMLLPIGDRSDKIFTEFTTAARRTGLQTSEFAQLIESRWNLSKLDPSDCSREIKILHAKLADEVEFQIESQAGAGELDWFKMGRLLYRTIGLRVLEDYFDALIMDGAEEAAESLKQSWQAAISDLQQLIYKATFSHTIKDMTVSFINRFKGCDKVEDQWDCGEQLALRIDRMLDIGQA